MEFVPRELTTPPLLLAALVGASPDLSAKLTEALHESGLAAHQQQKLVRYLSFSYDMRIPPCNRGAKDSPTYKVNGILKRRWLQKVCNTVPAVLVVCFDWSADPQHSQADEAQAISHLQHVRRQASERELRVLLFAVLHAGATDPASQCQALRREPEGPGLIVARGMDDVRAKAEKLEKLIYQNAMSFYQDEEKRHKKALTPRQGTMPRWAQRAMEVRTTLKIGFLNEFRRQAVGAMQCYIKAYELLMNDPEIADPVERLGLCNHISIRMYHLYLQSHEVASAVHHCKVHIHGTRRSFKEGDEVLAWRLWHWLALSHQLFAEIIESSAQQMPNLINQNDMWQFPGFHYQAAASYVSRLQQWAREESSWGGTLPPASGAGGDLLPAAFVGQADVLERPEECSDPAREVQLRDAHTQASQVKLGDRKLQLLTRAQAACKERGYSAGAALCVCRTADEYLVQGNLVASTKLYERLRKPATEAEPRQLGPWPQWPLLRRFALERSILCSCRDLGLQKEPAICFSIRPLQARTTVPRGEAARVEEIREDSKAKLAAARKRLLMDAFEYFALPTVARAGIDCSPTAELQVELLETVKGVWGPDAAEAGAAAVEVMLDNAVADISFHEEDAPGFSVSVQSPLSVPLEVAGLVASTSLGDVALTAAAGTTVQWSAGGVLEVRGSWPPAASSMGGACRVTAIRMSWVVAPSVTILVRGLRSPSRPEPPLPPFYPPSMTMPPWLGGRVSAEGVCRPADHAAHRLRAEVLTPVGPATALACEPFVFHVVVFSSAPARPQAPTGAPPQLWISCKTRYREDVDDTSSAGKGPGELSVGLLLRATGNSDSSPSSGLLPLPGDGTGGQAVAEIAEGGRLQPMAGSIVVLPAERLAGLPLQWDATEQPLAIPVAVRSVCPCQVTVSLRLSLQSAAGEDMSATAVEPSLILHFVPALQASFEDRASVAAGLRSHGAPRRFSVKSLSSTALELRHVGTVGAPGAEARGTDALGPMGCMEPGSSHTFLLPQVDAQEGEARSSLAVRFRRADAAASFFPWPGCKELLSQISLPIAVVSWPLPSDASKGGAQGSLQVDLEHNSTGAVAEPLHVGVRVRRSAQGTQEAQLRILRVEGGEGADKFLLGGPTSTHVLLVAEEGSQPHLCSTFTLVPLRPGWLAMPRVQVTAGSQEATSTPTSIFVFPSTQPCLPRTVA